MAVAIYSGYFGAGAGTLALAMLDAAKIGPFHKINALKTLIGTGANISASVVFIIQGAVDWPAAIMLCIGCFIGGYIAPAHHPQDSRKHHARRRRNRRHHSHHRSGAQNLLIHALH